MVNLVKDCPEPDIETVPQFMPLALPRIMAFRKKELVDDRVIFLLSEFAGEFPEDGFNFGKFKDKREIVFDARISKLNGISLDQKYLFSVIDTFIKTLSNDVPFLIYIEGHEKLTHLTMGDKDVWITGETNDLDVINNCIVASIINRLDEKLLDDDSRDWLRHADRLKGRLRARGENDT